MWQSVPRRGTLGAALLVAGIFAACAQTAGTQTRSPSSGGAAATTGGTSSTGGMSTGGASSSGGSSSTGASSSGGGASMSALPPSSTSASGSSGRMGAKPAAADRTFVLKAAAGGMKEVEAGKVAQQKATSDAVKQYASKMVDDHTKANDELKGIAGGKGIDLPAAPDKAAQADLAKLQKAGGAAFDKAYMNAMVADHKKTVALFTHEAKSGHDADLKAFAAKTLPTLQEHLKMAQTTAASLKGR